MHTRARARTRTIEMKKNKLNKKVIGEDLKLVLKCIVLYVLLLVITVVIHVVGVDAGALVPDFIFNLIL